MLDNETELEFLEHTTDTAGCTNLVFALGDLLSLEFTPRLRAAADQQALPNNGLRSLRQPERPFAAATSPA